MTIYEDTVVRLQAAFAGYDGLSVDPTTVAVRVEDPLGVLTTSTYPSVSWNHTKTGVYTYDVAVPETGVWNFAFEASGSVESYNESRFLVQAKGLG